MSSRNIKLSIVCFVAFSAVVSAQETYEHDCSNPFGDFSKTTPTTFPPRTNRQKYVCNDQASNRDMTEEFILSFKYQISSEATPPIDQHGDIVQWVNLLQFKREHVITDRTEDLNVKPLGDPTFIIMLYSPFEDTAHEPWKLGYDLLIYDQDNKYKYYDKLFGDLILDEVNTVQFQAYYDEQGQYRWTNVLNGMRRAFIAEGWNQAIKTEYFSQWQQDSLRTTSSLFDLQLENNPDPVRECDMPFGWFSDSNPINLVEYYTPEDGSAVPICPLNTHSFSANQRFSFDVFVPKGSFETAETTETSPFHFSIPDAPNMFVLFAPNRQAPNEEHGQWYVKIRSSQDQLSDITWSTDEGLFDEGETTTVVLQQIGSELDLIINGLSAGKTTLESSFEFQGAQLMSGQGLFNHDERYSNMVIGEAEVSDCLFNPLDPCSCSLQKSMTFLPKLVSQKTKSDHI